MTDLSDHELRARFDALRAADEQDAPGFRSVLDRMVRMTPAPARSRALWPMRVALSIAAALLLTAGLVQLSRRRAFVPQPLSTWRSPTESLLHTPGSTLLASPTLAPSALDHLTTTLAQREGK